MIEVFTTNIPNKTLGNLIIRSLKTHFSGCELTSMEAPIVNYPCDHSILRVEGATLDVQNTISHINENAYKCHILEGKTCT